MSTKHTTICVTHDTRRALQAEKGRLIADTGRQHSLDATIRHLLEFKRSHLAAQAGARN